MRTLMPMRTLMSMPAMTPSPVRATMTSANEDDLEEVYQCETISGELTFSDHDWITTIDLPCLNTVGGDFDILREDALTTLQIAAICMHNAAPHTR
jgi:hypothetical protein